MEWVDWRGSKNRWMANKNIKKRPKYLKNLFILIVPYLLYYKSYIILSASSRHVDFGLSYFIAASYSLFPRLLRAGRFAVYNKLYSQVLCSLN
jgi:hypothetical protein